MKPSQILIATDDSAAGQRAVETGIEIARGAGASATLVYVRPSPSRLGEPYYQRELGLDLREARLGLAKAARRVAEAGVPVETELLEGDPAEQVLELARRRDVDLIVVGSRGRRRIAEALLGSVSRAVVRGADRSVLVAKERAARARRAA
jgi:nucleotide-binding universal stress UspA family protein